MQWETEKIRVTRFLVIIWNGTCNISEVCLYSFWAKIFKLAKFQNYIGPLHEYKRRLWFLLLLNILTETKLTRL
jgi:hypothetical protein